MVCGDDLCQTKRGVNNNIRVVKMAARWRRPSSTDNEFSLSPSDEIRTKSSIERSIDQSTQPRRSTRLSEEERKWTIWMIHFIGFMDLFSVSMVIPLFPKLMRNLGASHALAGLIGSLYGMLQVFSSPIIGKLSDTYGRKSFLLLSYIGPFVGYVLMGFSGSILVLVISRIPNGILKHGLSISKAYLTDIASVQERRSVLGMFNACSSFGFIFGPLIGGYLADRDPTLQLSLLTGAGFFGLNFLLVALLVPSSSNQLQKNTDDATNAESESFLQWTKREVSVRYVLESLNIFKGLHWWSILDIIVVRFLMTFSVIIFRTNFTVFLEEHFQVSSTTFGQILSFNGVASALASATSGIMSRFYSSHVKQVLHFSLLLAISIACLTLAPNVSSVFLLLIPLSLSTSNLRICMLSLMLHRGREEEKGALVGLANSMSSLSRMLAPSIVGVIQDYSVEMAGYLSAVLALLAAGVVLLNPIEQNPSSNYDDDQTAKRL